MRNAFAAEVTALAKEDPRVVLCSGDIGNRLFDSFKLNCPDRFFNCGVAEANMISMAAGMAFCGLRPIVYTITPFVTTRCLEQIRVDICYHHVPVTIVGVGSGLSYASLGATHHSCEDIAFLRALPHMMVVCPADSMEVRTVLRAVLRQNQPVYIRLGKKGEPVIHQSVPDLVLGKPLIVREGTEICLMSTGNMMPVALETAAALNRDGVTPQVVSFHTIKPLDQQFLRAAFSHFGLVVTIEEHSLIGGFGAAVAEWLVDQGDQKGRLCRIGIKDEFFHEAGEQDYARERLGLTAEHIRQKILTASVSAASAR
jgi:transketolase